MTIIVVLLGITLVGTIAGIIMLASIVLELSAKLKQANESIEQLEERSRKNQKTQKAVIKGQISEQLYPLLKGIPYQASDMKFFGQPIDYIVLDGLSDGLIKEVIFVEVKTGVSQLSSIQRSLRDCINSGNVRFDTARISGESEHDTDVRTDREDTIEERPSGTSTSA